MWKKCSGKVIDLEKMFVVHTIGYSLYFPRTAQGVLLSIQWKDCSFPRNVGSIKPIDGRSKS